jgi:hypothetical protein
MKAPAMNADIRNASELQILADVAQDIRAVSDHIPPSEKIEMDTMLVADLALESIEVASIFFRLSERYQQYVSIADFLLQVVSEELISDLPVGRIVAFIADSAKPDPAGVVTAPEPDPGLAADS